ncbi:hypothetical protein ACP70R_032597 [Stipagrostis hirtigluma subsp. patula]
MAAVEEACRSDVAKMGDTLTKLDNSFKALVPPAKCSTLGRGCDARVPAPTSTPAIVPTSSKAISMLAFRRLITTPATVVLPLCPAANHSPPASLRVEYFIGIALLASSQTKPPHARSATVPDSIKQASQEPMASSAYGSGGGLPTHAAAPSAPAWPASTYTKPPPSHSPRRRCLCICLLVTLAVLLALAVTVLVLSLTVLRVRDPTTRLVSTRLAGVAARLTFPAVSIQLNVTLLLTVAVHNPNPASFSYMFGHTTPISHTAAPRWVRLALTVQADRLAADISQLVADVESGAVPMEASTRIPGRVTILGIFKRHAVAYSDCKFVLGVPELKVRSQECQDHTKL